MWLYRKSVWNRITVLQHLTNGNYRGYPYAVNYRKTKDGQTTSPRKTTEDEQVRLPQGVYPRVIDPDEFAAIQEQLRRNQEMSPRNNHRPNETLLRGGLVFCGICGRRMHVLRYQRRPHYLDYQCKQNWGSDKEHYHHSVGISVAILDAQVWEFARPYILNPVLVREHIDLVRGQVDPKMEKDLRETELLLTRFSNTTERSQKLLTALDKFEAWAISQQPYLRDPTYEITKEDKRAALLILGVTATVWPTEGYPDRVKFALSPPDIQRFCDFNFQ